MGIVEAIATFLATLLGWIKQREGLKNAPDVRSAAIAKEEAKEVDEDRKAVEGESTDEVRKRLS